MMRAQEQRNKEKPVKPGKASAAEDKMDDAIEASFPASDPSTSPMTTGAPKHERDVDHRAKKKEGHSGEK
jgi:hypothetical protein